MSKGDITILQGAGIRFTLIEGNDCLHYQIEGQELATDTGIWAGPLKDLLEVKLQPLGLKAVQVKTDSGVVAIGILFSASDR